MRRDAAIVLSACTNRKSHETVNATLLLPMPESVGCNF
jgi:hypothetical protein